MDEILELSRNNALPTRNQSRVLIPDQTDQDEPSYLAKTRIKSHIGALDLEITLIEEDIARLTNVKSDLLKEKRQL